MSVCLVASFAGSLIEFRGQLIRDFVEAGETVSVILPKNSCPDEVEKIKSELGIGCYLINLSSTGMNVFSDIRYLFELRSTLKKISPDILLAYTAKPVIYGMLASYGLKINCKVALITGLGSIFVSSSKKGQLVKYLMTLQYKLAANIANKFIFQNDDDRIEFIKRKIVDINKTSKVNGSGVNLNKYFSSHSPSVKPIKFLMVARLIRDKGVYEYINAAKILKQNYPDAEFNLVGYFSDNPSAISPVEMSSFINDGCVNFLGKSNDVKSMIDDHCSVFVLPSYREGVPRSVLEAMAMSRAIVTTQAPGCKDTVIDGVNGKKVPVQDSSALAEAMEYFILNPADVLTMGCQSRLLAEDKFDVRKVNHDMITIMGLQ